MNRDRTTQYKSETPEIIKRWLERVMHTDRRIRLFYGDTDTADFESVHGRKPDIGKDWGEEYDVTGTVGRSTGLKPIAILLNNSRSIGGGKIMDDRIVRMLVQGRNGWQEAYRHPNYHSELDNAKVIQSELAPQYSHTVVTNDGQEHARFHSEKSATRWLAFMRGERMSK